MKVASGPERDVVCASCQPTRGRLVGDGSAPQRSRPRPPGSSGACRVPPGAAAARRCPGSSSGRSTPEHSTRSRPGCRPAWRSSPRRTARRRRARCSRGILGSRYRLAWNNSGANLASGIASTLLSATRCRSRAARGRRVRTARGACRRVRPRVVSLGNLFRDQLDRYGELEHIAERWRAAVADAPSHLDARRQRRRSARRRPRGRTRPAPCASASTIRGSPVPRCSTRPTRSTASAAAIPTTTRRPTSATSATTAARTAGTRGPRSMSPRARSTCRRSTRRSSISSRRPARRG